MIFDSWSISTLSVSIYQDTLCTITQIKRVGFIPTKRVVERYECVWWNNFILSNLSLFMSELIREGKVTIVW